ncbi:MAG TPA: universal stress protein [Candidatus Marinimicrobia bacterium]|jgi:nucleotide-binding universal stress UspA family protein|nr:universal stress protein [Candidatus Neomarinimicrobiota bacterium]
MKFLLAVSSQEFSESTLRMGSKVAKSFGAQLAVVYVGPKPKELYAGRVSLARDTLAKWEIYHPGVEVLRWAFDDLKTSGFLENSDDNGFNPLNMVEEKGRYRMALPGSYGQDIDLILREGDIVDELRRECSEDEYMVSIIGGSKGRNMAHDLLQYLPTSVLVMKNVDLDRHYRILLCVDDSSATDRAVRFGATIAKQMNFPVTIMTVSKTEEFGPGYSGAAEAALQHLESQQVDHEQKFITGDPVNTFIETAGEDHLIVMGSSSKSALAKFFLGSKPMKTLEKANCPILVVRDK